MIFYDTPQGWIDHVLSKLPKSRYQKWGGAATTAVSVTWCRVNGVWKLDLSAAVGSYWLHLRREGHAPMSMRFDYAISPDSLAEVMERVGAIGCVDLSDVRSACGGGCAA